MKFENYCLYLSPKYSFVACYFFDLYFEIKIFCQKTLNQFIMNAIFQCKTS